MKQKLYVHKTDLEFFG